MESLNFEVTDKGLLKFYPLGLFTSLSIESLPTPPRVGSGLSI